MLVHDWDCKYVKAAGSLNWQTIVKQKSMQKQSWPVKWQTCNVRMIYTEVDLNLLFQELVTTSQVGTFAALTKLCKSHKLLKPLSNCCQIALTHAAFVIGLKGIERSIDRASKQSRLCQMRWMMIRDGEKNLCGCMFILQLSSLVLCHIPHWGKLLCHVASLFEICLFFWSMGNLIQVPNMKTAGLDYQIICCHPHEHAGINQTAAKVQLLRKTCPKREKEKENHVGTASAKQSSGHVGRHKKKHMIF